MLSEIVEIEHLSLNLKHKQMIPWKWKTQNNILHSLVCFVKEVGVNVNGTQGANCPILKRNFKTQFKKKKYWNFVVIATIPSLLSKNKVSFIWFHYCSSSMISFFFFPKTLIYIIHSSSSFMVAQIVKKNK